MTDPVNHPPHYTAHPSGVECITIAEHMNFNLGNALKYIWRAGLKSAGPLEDLEKARWYLTREIGRLRNEPRAVIVADRQLNAEEIERLREDWRDGAAVVIETCIAALGEMRQAGHCGEDTTETIARQRNNAVIEQCMQRLRALQTAKTA